MTKKKVVRKKQLTTKVGIDELKKEVIALEGFVEYIRTTLDKHRVVIRAGKTLFKVLFDKNSKMRKMANPVDVFVYETALKDLESKNVRRLQ